MKFKWRWLLAPFVSTPQLSPEEAQAAVAGGAFLVDCREDHEWASERIPGATLAPTSRFLEHVKELPKDRQIVVQCRSGSRSNQAAGWLRTQGYDAVNLAGGIMAWHAAGLPVES